MKLYYSPGACSQAPHIVLHELGIEHGRQKVSTKTKEMDGGGDFRSINPKGYVPALELDNGEILTENAAILEYLADSVPAGRALLPAVGELARYRVVEWLSFIGTELHKSFGPLFNPNASDEMRALAVSTIKRRFKYTDAQLAERDFVAGGAFSVADAYLFVVTGWCEHVKLDLTEYPNIVAFRGRVFARPAVQAALRHEGLL